MNLGDAFCLTLLCHVGDSWKSRSASGLILKLKGGGIWKRTSSASDFAMKSVYRELPEGNKSQHEYNHQKNFFLFYRLLAHRLKKISFCF